MPYFRRLFALEPIEYRDKSFPFFIRYLFVCSTTWTSILGKYLSLISSCDAGDSSDLACVQTSPPLRIFFLRQGGRLYTG